MAPREIEHQTRLIIGCLFGDKEATEFRQLDNEIEPDGPEDASDRFDPVVIADKLKKVADELNDERFNEALCKLKQAVAEEAMTAAFSQGVEALCRASASQKAEVAPELQLIKASVSLGLYVKKTAPELISRVQGAMTNFLNMRVGDWVERQGGWDAVADA